MFPKDQQGTEHISQLTSRSTVANITDLSHSLYSLDLALSDCHMCGLLKKSPSGKKFFMNNEVKTAAHSDCAVNQKNFLLEESKLSQSAFALAITRRGLY